MPRLFCLLLALALPSEAATYTVAAPHMTMYVGDPVPPLVFTISAYAGRYSATFRGEPERRTRATSTSAPGDYPIVVSQGSLRPTHADDHLTFLNGTITVLPADGIGAKLNNSIAYPPGFLGGPVGSAVMDVTKNPVANLVGDCVTDNAPAIAQLLSQGGKRTPATTNGGNMPLYLYFPPGCYATSQPLTIYGNSWTLWGSGPQRSYLRLLPNSDAFNTGTATQFFSPQSVTKNSNFREYIYNLGFNIGVGNANAIPFTTVQNNSGAIRNVQIWADDSACPYAINFNRAYPGPMLFKDVAVYGCKMAYSAGQGEFNITFENFTTEAQTATVLDNHFIKASLRHWLSDNTGQALHVYGSTTANVAVLDSKLLNGGKSTTGILVDKGSSVYLSNVSATGYNPTETDNGGDTAITHQGNISEAWTGSGRSLFSSSTVPGSLHLPVRETPRSSDPPVEQWTQLSQQVGSWPNEVLRAKSSTVYAAAGIYPATGTTQLTVPDSVGHLEFFQAKFNSGSPQLVLTVAGSSPKPLFIDGCPYESCQIVHAGSRPIVLRDATLYSYTARDGAGDLYVEDSVLNEGANGTLPVRFFASQHIWARQLNLEQRAADKFDCSGCTIWILGYKTEQASPSIVLTNGARAEVFGFFFYQNTAPTKEGSANIYLTDSSLFATGWTKVDVPGRGQPNWVVESRGASSQALATKDVNTSQQLTMFYSYGGEKRPGGKAGEPKRSEPSH